MSIDNQLIDYEHNDTKLEGYLAFDNSSTAAKPLVVIIHAWGGRDQFVCDKADKIAELGYVGFALDVYGKGKLGSSIEENSTLMQPFMDDRALLRDRLLAGLEIASQHRSVDSNRRAAMGYCFGGLCALDLARSGANLQGVISFHGLLTAPETIPPQTIKAKVLALHGYNDPMAPPEQAYGFANEMEQAKADWQLHAYGNTKHAFTNPKANDSNLGTVYNPDADKRSWQAMCNFLTEIF